MAANEPNIRDWFRQLQAVMEKYNITRPEQIYNCDETGFALQTKTGKVAMEMTDPDAYHITSATKQTITVLMMIRADGQVFAPYVIFPGKTQNSILAIDLPPGARA